MAERAATGGERGAAGMRYLGSDIVLHARTAEEFQRFVQSDFARTDVIIDPGSVPEFRMARIAWGGVALYYTEVDGAYVRVATSPATDVTLAVVTGGLLRALFDGDDLALRTGQGSVRLPGEPMLHAGEDPRGFTIRIPIDGVTLFRLRAWPHRKLAGFSHRLEAGECADMLRLAQFMSLERERTAHPGSLGGSDQMEVLGQALRARVLRLIESKTGLGADVDPEMLRICLAIDRRLRAEPAVRHVAADLASEALCSVRQTYRAFAEVAGLSPNEYLTRMRLQLLRQALLEDLQGDIDLAELGRRFGIAAQGYLIRLYRAEYDEAPRDTRERFQAYRRAVVKEHLPRLIRAQACVRTDRHP